MQYTTIPFEVKWPDQKLALEVASLYSYLDRVSDQRHRRGVRYPLRPLLAIAILAKLCGQNQLAELAHCTHHWVTDYVALSWANCAVSSVIKGPI